MEHNHEEILEHAEHSHGYGVYILVWMALMALTGITVAVAGLNFGGLTIATALGNRFYKIIFGANNIYAFKK